jgi:hypothetical protein
MRRKSNAGPLQRMSREAEVAIRRHSAPAIARTSVSNYRPFFSKVCLCNKQVKYKISAPNTRTMTPAPCNRQLQSCTGNGKKLRLREEQSGASVHQKRWCKRLECVEWRIGGGSRVGLRPVAKLIAATSRSPRNKRIFGSRL